MSVGGRVVETLQAADRVWINTRETGYSTECAVYVERTPAALSVEVGDSLWWQGGFAFWTPRRRSLGMKPPFVDKELKRIGCSGISRNQAMEYAAEHGGKRG